MHGKVLPFPTPAPHAHRRHYTAYSDIPELRIREGDRVIYDSSGVWAILPPIPFPVATLELEEQIGRLIRRRRHDDPAPLPPPRPAGRHRR